MSQTTVKTYIEMLEPGSFFAEDYAEEVDGRDPQRDAAAAGPRVFAFRYYDVMVGETPFGHDTVPVRSKPMNYSGYYYIDAEELSVADVRALNEAGPDAGRLDILISNMEGNGWDPILRCRTGNFRPKEQGDTVIRL